MARTLNGDMQAEVHAANGLMTTGVNDAEIHLALPKGRMQDGVLKLLTDANIEVKISDRGYRPTISLSNYTVKLLKPQNIIEMLATGSRDVGFGGSDWVANLGKEHQLVELLDTEMDPVRVVVAGPHEDYLEQVKQSGQLVRVASEYEKLTKDWIARNNMNAEFVRAYGATESFPPEDADIVVDNTATGSTLKANNLHVLETVFVSSTKLFANKSSYNNPQKRKRIDELVVLLKSVLCARQRAVLTFNLSKDALATVVPKLPCMRAPTVSELYNNSGYAVVVVVPKKTLPSLLPQLQTYGATDIITTPIQQLIV